MIHRRVLRFLVLAPLMLGACSTPAERDGDSASPGTAARPVDAPAPAFDPAGMTPIGEDRPIRIVATIGQIADLALAIGGTRVAVTQIVPGGDDPHRYVPTPRDVAALAAADVVLYNGLFLEAQMGETFEQMAGYGIPAVPVTSGFDLAALRQREYEPGRMVTDPHVWFDPGLWAGAADNVLAVLSALAPEHAADFEARAEDLAGQMDALAAWGRATMATVPEDQRVLVTSHDAFGYFGDAFGIDVRGLQGFSTETEAGTRDIEALSAFLAEQRVPAVFVEASVSPEALQAVIEAAQAGGHTVRVGGELFSDTPGAEGTAEGSYVGMVLWNVATVAAALGGTPDADLPPGVSNDPRFEYAPLVAEAVRRTAEREHAP